MSVALPVSIAELGASSESATVMPSRLSGVNRNCGLRRKTIPGGPQ
jgi:hypothetical protein